MTLDFSALLLGFTTYLIATASPGPANLAIMAASAGAGRRAGVLLAAGVVSGSMFWGACAALGLTSVMLLFPTLFIIIKLVGGVYLLWLAYKSWRTAMRPTVAATEELSGRDSRPYLKGLLIHLTNPKAILGWSSTIAIGVPLGAGPSQIAAMLLGCYILGLCIFFGYALLFSTSGARAAYQKFSRTIHAALCAVFGLAGLKLLSDVR